MQKMGLVRFWTVFVLSAGIYSCGNADSPRQVPDSETATPDTVAVATVKPVEETPSFSSARELLTYYMKTWESYYQKSKNATDPRLKTLFEDSAYFITRNKNNTLFAFLASHEKSAENFIELRHLVSKSLTDIPPQAIDSLFHSFPDSLKNSRNGKGFAAELKKKLEWGNMQAYDRSILDLPFTDTAGKSLTLKQLPAKYLLLDFWAAWCAPCRSQNRAMIKDRDQIEKNGKVAIVAFSLDDNRAKWIKASRQDSLNYLSISDLKGFDSPVANVFKISGRGIPYSVLIDKEGKILAKEIWGEDLLRVIASLP